MHNSWEKCELKYNRYHLVPVRITTIYKSVNSKCWWRCGKKEPQYTVGGKAHWCSQWKAISGKSKNGTALWPSDFSSGNLSKETWNTNAKEYKHPYVTAVLFTIAKIWKQPKCLSVDECIKQLWDIYTMEYYLAVKKEEILPLLTPKIIMLSEISQSEKYKYHMISLICGI